MDSNKKPQTLGTLSFLSGPLAGKTYSITRTVINLGRDTHNDVIISDPAVSRQHAQISLNNNGIWTIQKRNPQNMLTLNQRDVSQSPLSDQDIIGLGTQTSFRFQSSEQQTQVARPPQNQPLPSSFQGQTPDQPQVPAAPNYPGNGGVFGASSVSNPRIPAMPPAPPTGIYHIGALQNELDPTERMDDDEQPGVPSLVVSTNTDYDKHSYPLADDQRIFDIGRDPSNTIVINRPTVSGFHTQIIREGNDLVLIHPHPKRNRTLNGIIYQGHKIDGTEQFRHVLRRGDVFRISDQEGTFVSLTYNDGSGQAQEILPEIRPIPLGMPLLTIGRATDNMLVLNHPQVSGHHARLEQIPGGYRIIDLQSTNHVLVNGGRVNAQNLRPGDEVRIGPFKLTYTGTEFTQHDESQGIRIDVSHLIQRGNKNVVLLNDLSFVIPARKFVALVGGSGAGKSTLMNALNGYRPASEGVVLYNGQDYYKQLEAYSNQLGYVPQDDIIHRDLTVERALYYAAKLRLPADFTEEQIKERIDEVLEDVEIKHRRNLLISQLSGGQRKRVSIALELLAKPAIFFLDEPTSGLDPGLDRKMMLLLRKLADKGHTIILVTHATNNINACDYICFLCQGGHLAYFGPPDGAKAYFGRTDFAEIYSALEPTEERPQAPEEAEARFKESPDYTRYIIEPLLQGPLGRTRTPAPNTPARPRRGDPWKQFFLLSRRYVELIFNDRVNLAILLLQAPIIGLILLMMTRTTAFASTSITPCTAPANLATMSGPPTTYDCQVIVNMLQTPQGEAFARSQNKKPDEVLQSSILLSVREQGILPGFGAQKILFIMAFAAIVFGSLNGSREIVKERAIYQRERAVNLSIAPYLFSKIVVLGTFSLLQSLLLVFLVHIKSPLGQTHSILLPAFIEIFITMSLTSLAGLMTGLLISAVVPNNDRAMSLMPLPLIPQVVFAGVIFNLDDPSVLQIIGALFPVRWAMAAMGSTIGLHGDLLRTDNFSFQGLQFTHVEITPADQFAAATHLLLCWVALILITAVQIGAIVWCLKRRDVRK
jgi:ABC-type multidrug transport system ATPase subunit/pSer/pThr/pTyr-binding forkhead associated (FHA) protein